METQLLDIKKFSSEKVKYYNAFLGYRRNGSFSVNNKKCLFEFGEKLSVYVANYYIKAKIGGHDIVIGIQGVPPMLLASDVFKEIPIEDLPQEMMPTLLEVLWERVIETLEKSLNATITIEAISQEPFEETYTEEFPFTIKIEDASETLLGHIALNMSTLEYITHLLGAPQYNNIQLKDILNPVPFHMSVVIGHLRLTAKEFKSVELKDILMIPAKEFYENGKCQAILENKYLLKAKYSNGRINVSNIMDDNLENELNVNNTLHSFDDEEDENFDEEDEEFEGEDTEEEEEPEKKPQQEASSSGSPLDTGKVPVHLMFEVGSKKIALSELQQLSKGHTFELSNPLETPVTIRANGKVIGSGELLNIGGRIGVRVSSFVDHG